MSAAPESFGGGAGRLRISLGFLQRASLGLFVFTGAYVIVEPSPYELIFPVTLICFAFAGLRLSAELVPLILLLLLFIAGGFMSLVPYLAEGPSVTFIAISFYLALTSIFFAALMAEDTLARLETIRSALIASAWLAGGAALIGYMGLFGLGEKFTHFGRASGTFKDPNVLGPYLVLPIVYIVQAMLLGRAGAVRTLLLASVPMAALFLSFSRGAWADLVMALGLTFLLTFLTSRTRGLRLRMLVHAVVLVVALVAMLTAVLSVDSIREVFQSRAALEQDYDSGVTGRFGNQLRSIPMLLESFNGFGPLRFHYYFKADPHNVYINAFASYGWIGGFAYLGLIAATWVVGWTAVFRRGPFQSHAIAIWSTLSVITVQGYQIDTDHWRHFYLMLGLIWGIATIAQRDRSRSAT